MPQSHFNTDRAFEALKREYTLIRKGHIKAWQAWLIVGIFAGAIGATVFIANRSGEVEKGRASGTAEIALPLNVELDLPSYFSDSLRRPQRIFSGRKLLIKNAAPFKKSSASLSSPDASPITLKAEQSKEHTRGLRIEIPTNVPSGVYQISYTLDGASTSFPLTIHGLTPQEAQPAPVSIASTPSDSTVVYRTRICDGCYWEMVFAGDPIDPKNLVQNSGNLLSRSTTAGRTWTSEYVDNITQFPRPGMSNSGDPKIVAINNLGGSGQGFYLSSLFYATSNSTPPFFLGGMVSYGMYSGTLKGLIFQDRPVNPPEGALLFSDYPKMAVDPKSSTLYISANSWFEDIQGQRVGLHISRDSGRTFTKQKIGDGIGSNITSMVVGQDGTLYGVRPGVGTNDQILRFGSVQPLSFDTYALPGRRSFWPAKISTNSNRAWAVYGGPEIVADNSSESPHRGRLYAVWAQEERVIEDSNFEYPYYGYNFDVFASYSDNRGETWSQPVKVNDDVGTGDQFFPSARIDDIGRLSIAFVDHRDNQDQPVFDIYYASSRDGMTFSKNIRITDTPTSNNSNGGRTIGDYLDMVAVYSDRTYVAYPCGQSADGPTGACMVEVRLSPSPDIRANSSDGPIAISPSGAISIAVSLDPGSSAGKPADWWAAAQTPFGLHWYTVDRGWVRSDAPIRGYAGPLINLPSTVILSVNTAPAPAPSNSPLKAQSLPGVAASTIIPIGTYTFHFGIDTNQNGVLDEPSFRDAVTVQVTP